MSTQPEDWKRARTHEWTATKREDLFRCRFCGIVMHQETPLEEILECKKVWTPEVNQWNQRWGTLWSRNML